MNLQDDSYAVCDWAVANQALRWRLSVLIQDGIIIAWTMIRTYTIRRAFGRGKDPSEFEP